MAARSSQDLAYCRRATARKKLFKIAAKTRHRRSQHIHLCPRLNGGRARGPDGREVRHENSPLDRTNHGSCSRYWQRLGGHELLLQNRPSLLVRAGFRHPTPRKSRFVKTDYRISVMSDRANACRRQAEDCERAASRVTDVQVRAITVKWPADGVRRPSGSKLSKGFFLTCPSH